MGNFPPAAAISVHLPASASSIRVRRTKYVRQHRPDGAASVWQVVTHQGLVASARFFCGLWCVLHATFATPLGAL